MRFKSIRTKLSLFFGILVFVICGGLGFISYINSTQILSDNINESITQMAREASKGVARELKEHTNALEALAGSDMLKSNTLNTEEKLKLLDYEVERCGHISMGIIDLQGNLTLSDGSSSNVANRDYFKNAVAGKVSISDPIVSSIDQSIVLIYAVPIKEDSSIKSVLIAVRDGNELSDMTKDVHFSDSGQALMVNKDGTTIANQNPEYVRMMFNTIEEAKKNPDFESWAHVLKIMMEGKEGVGEYIYQGDVNYIGYAPVEGTDWSLAITAPKDKVMHKVDLLSLIITASSAVFLALSVVITIIISTSISRPIKESAKLLKTMATGDFTQQISKKLLVMRDENGILASSIQTMQQSFKNIISKVIEESTDVSQMLTSINTGMHQLNKSIEEISATSEELSAGAEETAVSTEEMNATSEQIEKTVETIASKAQEGTGIVSTVNSMAAEMKRNAIASKGNAVRIYGKTKNDLQNAIMQAEAVNQIDELSEAILEITAQTNLLALNAAIEAARAGEAGKGFAVVAEEIRKLAENSKHAVSRIQEVTRTIYSAVNNLSISSGEILTFVDKEVLKDYDSLVDTSEQFNQSSASINDMVMDYSASSEELFASMHSMVKAIEEITSASNEEAQGAYNIAQETSAIAMRSNDVTKMAEAARSRSEELITAVSVFKV